MPTYGYRCEACENTFEVFQKVDEKPITKCPSCSGKTVRVFYPVGVIFKGSGFYKTDYCKKPSESKLESKSDKKTSSHKKEVSSSDENKESPVKNQ